MAGEKREQRDRVGRTTASSITAALSKLEADDRLSRHLGLLDWLLIMLPIIITSCFYLFLGR